MSKKQKYTEVFATETKDGITKGKMYYAQGKKDKILDDRFVCILNERSAWTWYFSKYFTLQEGGIKK